MAGELTRETIMRNNLAKPALILLAENLVYWVSGHNTEVLPEHYEARFYISLKPQETGREITANDIRSTNLKITALAKLAGINIATREDAVRMDTDMCAGFILSEDPGNIRNGTSNVPALIAAIEEAHALSRLSAVIESSDPYIFKQSDALVIRGEYTKENKFLYTITEDAGISCSINTPHSFTPVACGLASSGQFGDMELKRVTDNSTYPLVTALNKMGIKCHGNRDVSLIPPPNNFYLIIEDQESARELQRQCKEYDRMKRERQ
jgi:hypothetical protein